MKQNKTFFIRIVIATIQEEQIKIENNKFRHTEQENKNYIRI
jgi:hypothetical protein